MTQNVAAIILAAGEGKRMMSSLAKTTHRIAGIPIVAHVARAAIGAEAERIVVVVGKDADQVIAACGPGAEFVVQAERLGTGHACQQAEQLLGNYEGVVLVLCGDAPLITERTLKKMLTEHNNTGSVATVLTAFPRETRGLGRISRDASGAFKEIVEEKDADETELAIREINAGFYCFNSQALFEALRHIDNNNAQSEYMLTDVLALLTTNGRVCTVITEDFSETIGVNDRVWLSKAEEAMQARIREKLMWAGVTILSPSSTYIESDVAIAKDTVIYPGSVLRGSTHIGEGCEIGPHAILQNATIGAKTTVINSVISDSRVGEHCNIGPFAHLRPENSIGDYVRVGNFVEVKKSQIGARSKIKHLSYVGDAIVGRDVNMGAGTIVVNHDGVNKHQTIILDNAFIGCNSNLVAPVTIGESAVVAAGSTITKDVPAFSLGVGRARQENKEGWVHRRGVRP
ncbi:MAG: bifunctional UDP-N-acetylglucosamine pyrophosphorylase / Glucosamine-1-phosphate N-acetyltransferase [Bacillota bacterium]|nr:MAG: bifunctional UDP-N-acetylglucosamine pyrophosphorylase / Glucosamine-1-phosphate N-acetyltransferase [Bacillota bacterium]MBS3950613.1 bifunctional UDP-N-acetylglucosamine diphosphorylase/glucosamine-1-phosphate N-acetyltransferase GlmU [Peptococcaceae bacterium]